MNTFVQIAKHYMPKECQGIYSKNLSNLTIIQKNLNA